MEKLDESKLEILAEIIDKKVYKKKKRKITGRRKLLCKNNIGGKEKII